jgi:hypothetical protein
VFSSGTPGKTNRIRKSLLVCDADHKIRFGRWHSSKAVALWNAHPWPTARTVLALANPSMSLPFRPLPPPGRVEPSRPWPMSWMIIGRPVGARATIAQTVVVHFLGRDVVWGWKQS